MRIRVKDRELKFLLMTLDSAEKHLSTRLEAGKKDPKFTIAEKGEIYYQLQAIKSFKRETKFATERQKLVYQNNSVSK